MLNNSLDPLKTSSYDYTLPKELIATHPVHPVDSARLLVYNRKTETITHTTFKNIMDFYYEKKLFKSFDLIILRCNCKFKITYDMIKIWIIFWNINNH